MSRFWLPFLLVFAGRILAAAAVEGGAMDVQKAINTALTQNRDLARLALQLESALLTEGGAEDEFKPNLQPLGQVGRSQDAASYTYGLRALQRFTWGTDVELSGQASEAGLSDSAFSARDSIKASVSQPLFRYAGPLVNGERIRKARSGVAAAQRTVEMKKTDLVVEVVALYENILRLQRQLESDILATKRLDKLFRLSRAKELQGRSTRVDSLRVELQVGQAQARLQNTTEQLLSIRQDFADLLGFTPDTAFEISVAPTLDLAVPEKDGEAIRIALENRLDFAQSLQDYRDAARGMKIAGRNLLPNIKVVGRYEKYGQGQNTSEAWPLDNDEWFVGLVADTDLMKRSEKTAYRQSIISKQTAFDNIDSARNMISRQVSQQRLAYARACSEVVIAGRNLTLADNRLKLARKLYELGRGDSFAVSDAEDEYSKAQQEFLRTQAEVSIAGYRMLRSMGTLLPYPNELKPQPLSEHEKE
ncbi:MAG: TolC family protein [Lentisphaerota bacterium]